nr:PDZ domain-containing protein [Gammaproteobacteria bacterium]
LGTIPDFTYQGEGYRLDGVIPNSPAQQSGLQKYDIIKKINDQTINGLRDVSRVLKSLAPGQMITIRFQRDQKVLEAQARLSQR